MFLVFKLGLYMPKITRNLLHISKQNLLSFLGLRPTDPYRNSPLDPAPFSRPLLYNLARNIQNGI